MRNPLVVIWNYCKNSWEDDRGHLSFKRVSAYVFIGLAAWMVLTHEITNSWKFYAFLVLTVAFCLVVGIITAAQLVQMVKYGSVLNTSNYGYGQSNNEEAGDSLAPGTGDSVAGNPDFMQPGTSGPASSQEGDSSQP